MSNEPLFVFLNRRTQKEMESVSKMMPNLKSLCRHGYANGYVAVPPSHPLHHMDCDKADKFVEVSGCLTLSCSVEDLLYEDEVTECIGFSSFGEIPKDYWVFGFDTLHFFDGPHHDRQWCIEETMSLKRQLETIRNKKQELC